MANKDVAIKKRQLISRANRNMFIVVASASVVLGFAIVGSIFLFQKMLFNAKVIGEKQNTVNILKDNNKVYPDLAKNISALSANGDLRNAMLGTEDSTLRVISDSLPSTNNPAALGASLSDKLLTSVSGVALESITVDRNNGSVNLSSSGNTNGGSANPISTTGFTFRIHGSAENVKQTMVNLERSIRFVDITRYRFSYASDSLTLNGTARAYFVNEVSTDLQTKEVRP